MKKTLVTFLEHLKRCLVFLHSSLASCSIPALFGLKILAAHSSSETQTPSLWSGSKKITLITGVRSPFFCAMLMFANGASFIGVGVP